MVATLVLQAISSYRRSMRLQPMIRGETIIPATPHYTRNRCRCEHHSHATIRVNPRI